MLKTKELKFFDLCEFEEIVNHYIDISDFTKTKKAIDLGLNQHPNSCELLILKAEHYILTNHYESAALIIDDLMVVHPKNEIIYQHKAAILSKKNLHEDAIEILKKGMRFCHNYSEFNSLIALEYLYIEEYFMAKEYFIKCLNKDDRDNHSLYNIIYCFESMNDNLGAISFLNECLNKNPYNEVAWHQIGRQYFEIRMYEQALVSFDYAIICDEKFVGAYFELAKTLEKLGRYKEAISFYEITLSIDDPTSFAFHRIGECHLLLGNDLLGLKYLKKTIHEDPLLEKGWISLCNYYLIKKNYREAIHYINKALKIDDSNYFF
jgi:tetratricopeptide (TPR) repeat protein